MSRVVTDGGRGAVYPPQWSNYKKGNGGAGEKNGSPPGSPKINIGGAPGGPGPPGPPQNLYQGGLGGSKFFQAPPYILLHYLT